MTSSVKNFTAIKAVKLKRHKLKLGRTVKQFDSTHYAMKCRFLLREVMNWFDERVER